MWKIVDLCVEYVGISIVACEFLLSFPNTYQCLCMDHLHRVNGLLGRYQHLLHNHNIINNKKDVDHTVFYETYAKLCRMGMDFIQDGMSYKDVSKYLKAVYEICFQKCHQGHGNMIQTEVARMHVDVDADVDLDFNVGTDADDASMNTTKYETASVVGGERNGNGKAILFRAIECGLPWLGLQYIIRDTRNKGNALDDQRERHRQQEQKRNDADDAGVSVAADTRLLLPTSLFAASVGKDLDTIYELLLRGGGCGLFDRAILM